MNNNLYIGFKGKNNSSCILVKSLSSNHYLLTNSFNGLKSDIESLCDTYDYIVLFGIDKELIDNVRIEKIALKETKEFSRLNLDNLSKKLNSAGISNYISDKPTHYLCNDAYWHLLHKFNGNVVLIHIPSIKNINDKFIENMKHVFQ